MTINFYERKQNHRLLATFLVIFLGTISGILSSFTGIYSLLLIPLILYALFIWKANLNAKTATILIILTIYVNFLRPLSVYNVSVIAIDLTVIILLCKHIISKGIKVSNISKFVLLILTMFCLISLVQMFNPNIPEFRAGLEGFRKTFLAFLFFYTGVFSFKNINEIKLAFVKISIFSIPVLLYGIKQYLFPSEFDLLYILSNDADKYTGMLFGKTRSTSIFAGSFHLGIFSAILSMISFYLFKIQKKLKNKALFLLIFSLALFSCYVSLTRTNLLAITGALIVYSFYKLSLKKKIIFSPLLFTFFGFIWFFINEFKSFLINSDNDFYRMIFTIIEFDNDTRFLGRAHGWEEVFTLIKLNPLGAYGTGSAGDTLQNNYDFTYHLTSHNFFFKIMMETGFFGLSLILIFFIVLIIQLINVKKNGDFEFTALTLGILAIFFINSVVGSTIETYPAAGLMMFIFGILFSDGVKNNFRSQY